MIQQLTHLELNVRHPDGHTQLVKLKSDTGVFAGLSSNCGLRLAGDGISDIHCRIGFEAGRLWVQNWVSAKPTLLNGVEVQSKSEVGPGDLITVGPYSIEPTGFDLNGRLDMNPETSSVPAPPAVPAPSESPTGRVPPQPTPPRPTPSQPKTIAKVPKSTPPQPEYFASDETDSDFELALDLLVDDDEAPTYDQETVALLQAEIDDLRSALAQRDAEARSSTMQGTPNQGDSLERSPDSERMMQRMRQLIDEANRAEERVLLLEEMLHAAEDCNRAEAEERTHLMAWVGDIEKRIGQREQEQRAEADVLRRRLKESQNEVKRLQGKIKQFATSQTDSAPVNVDSSLDELQERNHALENRLAESERIQRELHSKLDNQAEANEVALREERAKLAKESAEVSRMRFEFAQRLKEDEAIPPSGTNQRLQGLLDEHRRELKKMSAEREQESTTLTGRLRGLWTRVDQDKY